MNLICRLNGHKRVSEKSWDGEFHHSSCARCGAALVRLPGDRVWRLPDDTELRYIEKMREGSLVGAVEATGPAT